MTSPTREEILEWLSRNLPEPASVPVETPSDLSSAELAKIFEGLAQAVRPIRAATTEITRQYDLGPRGAFALSLISGGIVHPLDLALALGIRPSSATAELRRLYEAGLVETQQDDNDRRKTVLSLTPTGHEANERALQSMAATVLTNLKEYSAAEMRLFSRMLSDVRKGRQVT